MAELIALKTPEYRPTTLEEVWQEAEALGEVSVRGQSFGKRYEAQIYFKGKYGSVFAKAEHDSPLIALGLAINNARQLGAGEPG